TRASPSSRSTPTWSATASSSPRRPSSTASSTRSSPSTSADDPRGAVLGPAQADHLDRDRLRGNRQPMLAAGQREQPLAAVAHAHRDVVGRRVARRLEADPPALPGALHANAAGAPGPEQRRAVVADHALDAGDAVARDPRDDRALPGAAA